MGNCYKTRNYFTTKGDNNKKSVIFVFGGPKTGKTTQCLKLIEKYGFGYISYDDINETIKQREPRTSIVMGNENSMSNNKTKCHYLLDEVNLLKNKVILVEGFPNEKKDLVEWKEIIGSKLWVKCMIHLYCLKDNMKYRIDSRMDNIDTEIQIKMIDDFFLKKNMILEICQKELDIYSISTNGTIDSTSFDICTCLDKRNS